MTYILASTLLATCTHFDTTHPSSSSMSLSSLQILFCLLTALICIFKLGIDLNSCWAWGIYHMVCLALKRAQKINAEMILQPLTAILRWGSYLDLFPRTSDFWGEFLAFLKLLASCKLGCNWVVRSKSGASWEAMNSQRKDYNHLSFAFCKKSRLLGGGLE